MKIWNLLIIIAILSSCSMSKTLDREVRVRIDANLPLSIFNDSRSDWSGKFTETQYKEMFLSSMKSEFSSSNVIIDDVNPEFEVRFDQFSITETTNWDSVKDSTSAANGTEYDLSTLNVVANGTVVRLSDNVSYSWSAGKSKAEKITSMQNASQMAAGENKNNDQYREKHFSDNEAGSLASKVGRKSGTAIVKEIFRALK